MSIHEQSSMEEVIVGTANEWGAPLLTVPSEIKQMITTLYELSHWPVDHLINILQTFKLHQEVDQRLQKGDKKNILLFYLRSQTYTKGVPTVLSHISDTH